jgi:hypothetical protein
MKAIVLDLSTLEPENHDNELSKKVNDFIAKTEQDDIKPNDPVTPKKIENALPMVS